jgi:hypothetical protein
MVFKIFLGRYHFKHLQDKPFYKGVINRPPPIEIKLKSGLNKILAEAILLIGILNAPRLQQSLIIYKEKCYDYINNIIASSKEFPENKTSFLGNSV